MTSFFFFFSEKIRQDRQFTKAFFPKQTIQKYTENFLEIKLSQVTDIPDFYVLGSILQRGGGDWEWRDERGLLLTNLERSSMVDLIRKCSSLKRM